MDVNEPLIFNIFVNVVVYILTSNRRVISEMNWESASVSLSNGFDTEQSNLLLTSQWLTP